MPSPSGSRAPLTTIRAVSATDREAAYGAADVLAVPLPAGGGAGPGAERALADYGCRLADVVAAERASGRVGEVIRVPVQVPAERAGRLPGRLLLVGTGSGEPGELRRAAAALARSVRGRRVLVTTLGSGGSPAAVQAVAEGLILGGYSPPAAGLRSREDSAAVAEAVLISRTAGAQIDEALAVGTSLATATVRARDWAATPANIKSPQWMADQAREMAHQSGLEFRQWERDELAAEGFGGLLAVGSGSIHDPTLVQLGYRPAGAPSGSAAERPIVLIGKGITFDTGGLSIKPREAMVPMKTDMTGAAVVLSVLAGCRSLGVRHPVIGLLPLAENAVGGASYRPGDVVRPFAGPTVEVSNTDAEGRLVLADALAYGDRRLDPDVMIDIATLTGAASLGLGAKHAALYSADDRLAAELIRAGERSGEPAWRMPLVEDYRSQLDSSIADLRQVAADPKAGGGSITAALFLREYTGDRRWAHLDIAGPARSAKDDFEVGKGATGWGARLLLRWLAGVNRPA